MFINLLAKPSYGWDSNIHGFTDPAYPVVIPCRRDGYTRINQMVSKPTGAPSKSAAPKSTFGTTRRPTSEYTSKPSVKPTTNKPATTQPFQSTVKPTYQPTSKYVSPSKRPLAEPTFEPSDAPTIEPAISPTELPTISIRPSYKRTFKPSTTRPSRPTRIPTLEPSYEPTLEPTRTNLISIPLHIDELAYFNTIHFQMQRTKQIHRLSLQLIQHFRQLWIRSVQFPPSQANHRIELQRCQ